MEPSQPLLALYRSDKRIESILKHFQSDNDEPLYIKNICASSRAVAIAACHGTQSQVVVCNESDEAPNIYYDLGKLLGNNNVFYFPSSFKRQVTATGYDAQNIQLRTEALSHLLDTKQSVIVVTYPEALTERIITSQTLAQNTFGISVGNTLSISFLVDVLNEYGFQRVDFVFEPGQFSVRGSIVDVFSFADDNPYRIDFFGDDVDSIRTFELDTQLSVERLEQIVIIPDINRNIDNSELLPLFEALPKNLPVWLESIDYMRDKATLFFDAIRPSQSEDGECKISLQSFCSGNELHTLVSSHPNVVFGVSSNKGKSIDFGTTAQPIFHKNFDLLEDDIFYKTQEGYSVNILSDNRRQLERLKSILSDRGRKLKYNEINMSLHEGFVDTINKLCFYTDHQIFERFHKYSLRNERMRSAQQSITLKELCQLNPGDFVVHIDHGIGKFAGLVRTEEDGHVQESVRLIFRDNDSLLVSIHSLHRISKYRGKDGIEPKISKLGTTAWAKLKEKTKSKVKDIARDLIALYAKRKSEPGFAYSPDSFMQHELEASFLYEDTPDQYKATIAIKTDMEKDSPMDRLVCGDVGFGKTELAVRAAFKAVSDNKQVAVLVPTTVLAFQHYNTFKERLKDFPCKVEYLSRLRKASEQRDVLKGIESGDVNIVIGTHRLIGKDVKFHDIGLLIIDEEQHFGVSVKEKLRAIKVNVDTLTLSATPIPRTLQFSLMGARDLSILSTPPTNRQPIVTEVHTFDEAVFRDAINYEVERGGQVFVINNRIQHLYELEKMLNKLLPDVRTVVAHGQMEGTTLESIMLDFIAGDYDVLLATTIIESGLDISNANTIIVNNAHQFGLSELHQLRGRVGRSNKKAFCYLLAPPLTTLTQEARRRLKIIEEYSDLGSGFNIAMQDMDIRGAGDVLGAEQSGFISDIGYETYQKILSEALVELKQNEYRELFAEEKEQAQAMKDVQFVADTQIDTDEELLFPESYVNSISERMSLYRSLDDIQDESGIETFRNNLIDRFGPLPEVSNELLNVVKIRILAQKLGIERIAFKKKQLLIYFVSDGESPYYQTQLFTSILGWIQSNPKLVSVKMSKGKFFLSSKSIKTMHDLLIMIKNIAEIAIPGELVKEQN